MLEEQRKKKEGGKSSRKHLHKTLVRILGHILIKKFHSKKITKSSNNEIKIIEISIVVHLRVQQYSWVKSQLGILCPRNN